MKNLQKKLILLLLPLLLAATFSVQAQPGGIKVSLPWVFGYSFDKGLYKAQLSAYGNELSGLLFVKKTNDSFRFVFLSEVGLKYFDIEVANDSSSDYRIHYMMEALNRKPLLDFFERSFRMLTLSWGEFTEKNSFVCDGSQERVVILKSKEHGKFRYDYHPNFGQVSQLWSYGFLKKKLTVEPSGYDYKSPENILITQKKIRFRLKRIQK